MNRRDTLKAFATMAAVGLAGRSSPSLAQSAPPAGPFTLPPLGYDYGALEPHIDAETMMIHHQRHHGAYVSNANALAANVPALRTRSIEQILGDLAALPESSRAGVRNNVGGHWNHSFFWELMQPGGAKEPAGAVKAAIDSQLGGVAPLRERINAAGMGRFGSGWAWLVVGKDRKLEVVSTPNQDNPLMEGTAGVILGVDVWEHAYYLKYRNRRADYLTAWWNTVNWDRVEANFRKAMA
jgi:Fe-Mn family superoxide dismutase